mmetsp:Transcript_26318/g.79858  ORF Transcript_26318/g.79858 Transcript_26318/m.79858 type:complete len:240 (-) Transcript_26318:2423-3142(-)
MVVAWRLIRARGEATRKGRRMIQKRRLGGAITATHEFADGPPQQRSVLRLTRAWLLERHGIRREGARLAGGGRGRLAPIEVLPRAAVVGRGRHVGRWDRRLDAQHRSVGRPCWRWERGGATRVQPAREATRQLERAARADRPSGRAVLVVARGDGSVEGEGGLERAHRLARSSGAAHEQARGHRALKRNVGPEERAQLGKKTTDGPHLIESSGVEAGAVHNRIKVGAHGPSDDLAKAVD